MIRPLATFLSDIGLSLYGYGILGKACICFVAKGLRYDHATQEHSPKLEKTTSCFGIGLKTYVIPCGRRSGMWHDMNLVKGYDLNIDK